MYPERVCVIGAGKLGRPIVRRLLTIFSPGQISLCRANKDRLSELAAEFPECQVHQTCTEAIRETELVVLAVRPQDLAQVGLDLNGNLSEKHIVLSLITGKSFASLKRYLKTDRLARASTSIFLADGKAVTYLLPSAALDHRQIECCLTIAETWGQVRDAKAEQMIDLTIVELGAQAGILAFMMSQIVDVFKALGQCPRQAEQNLISSLESLACQCRGGKTLNEIVAQVQTKGGITSAAIEVLESNALNSVLKAGIKAALDRTKHLDG